MKLLAGLFLLTLVVMPAELPAETPSGFSEKIRLWENPISAFAPVICSSDRFVYTAWNTENELYFSRSTDGGISFENARRIDAIDAESDILLGNLETGVDFQGRLFLLYTIYSFDLQNPTLTLYKQTSNDNGLTFETEPVFSTELGLIYAVMFGSDLKMTDSAIHYLWSGMGLIFLASSYDGGDNFEITKVADGQSDDESAYPKQHIHPSLAVDTDSTIFVTWFGAFAEDIPETGYILFDLYLAEMENGRDSFTEPAMIAECGSWGASIYSPQSVIAPNGELHIFWNKAAESLSNASQSPLFHMYSSDGGSTFSEPVEITLGASAENAGTGNGGPAVWLLDVAENGHGLHFAYSVLGALYYSGSSDFGTSFDSESRISDWGGLASMTVNENNDAFVAWTEDSAQQSGVYFARSGDKAPNQGNGSASESSDGEGGGCFISGILR